MARHLAATALLCGLLVLLCQQQPAWAQTGNEADPFPPADPVPGDSPAATTAAAPAEPASANNVTQPSADDLFGTGAVGQNGQDLSAVSRLHPSILPSPRSSAMHLPSDKLTKWNDTA